MRHELKTWPQYYVEIMSGKKTFEVRFDDRDFQVGDMVLLQEWNPESEQYTGREAERVITYIIRDFPGITSGWCVFSIR